MLGLRLDIASHESGRADLAPAAVPGDSSRGSHESCACNAGVLGVPVERNGECAADCFQLTIPGADGSLNGTPFVGQNVVVVLTADTTQVGPGSVGSCVPASSGSVQVGVAAPVALAAPLFVCAAPNSAVIYLGPTNSAGSPAATFVAGGFSPRTYDLTTSYPFSVNVPGEIGGGASLNTGSGTVFLSTFPSVGFSATVPNLSGIPTLEPMPLVGLSLLLALASFVALRRRTG